jgi:hypothetical protein
VNEDWNLIADLKTVAASHRADGNTRTAWIIERAAERIQDLITAESKSANVQRSDRQPS